MPLPFVKSFSVLCLLYAPEVFANNMINNTAYAYVDGSIIQKAEGQSTNIINIGSIIGKNLTNNNVSATVQGNIVVETNNGQTTVLSVGSITRK